MTDITMIETQLAYLENIQSQRKLSGEEVKELEVLIKLKLLMKEKAEPQDLFNGPDMDENEILEVLSSNGTTNS